MGSFDTSFFDELAKKLSEAVPENVKALREDMEKHFRNIAQTMFAKMDLITREEFDIQVLVLSKTRAKLEALEGRLNAWDKKLTEESLAQTHKPSTEDAEKN